METAGNVLVKSPTGIQGLDEILNGGLPQGRITLVAGGPGSGKSLLATEFVVNGAVKYGEPGVILTFEETQDDLEKNLASLGIDLKALIDQNKIYVDHVYIERSEIEETGEYDLEGLFIRLAAAVATIGAKRVVLDTIETIFSGFSNENIMRSEIRRLFRWLKNRNLTAVVTGERGDGKLTRYGLEEYISDCVILLDNRVNDKISTRTLRVIKYRGSSHSTDEFPFLIDNEGLWVQPVTSSGLNYSVSNEFVSSGVLELDRMLDRKGFFRGSTNIISGSAGTGKTSLVASMVDAACQRGERCLYFAFEEAPSQIIRNMQSIGLDLGRWQEQGQLKFYAARPSFYGIEMHLLTMIKAIDEYQPHLVVVDPLTNMISIASDTEVKSMLVRLIDYLKMKGITSVFTSLVRGHARDGSTESEVSSLMDAWIMLRNVESSGERNRRLDILKSRGMAHSTRVAEYLITSQGIKMVDIVVGPQGIVIGSERIAQQSRDREARLRYKLDLERKQRELERKRALVHSQITALQAELEEAEARHLADIAQDAEFQNLQEENAQSIIQSQGGDGSSQNQEE